MEQRANGSWRFVMSGLALATGLLVGATANAQRAEASDKEAEAQAQAQAQGGGFDAQTSKILNEAIVLLNEEKFVEAGAKINTLQLDKLSPYERGKVEQILFNIAYSQDKFAEARDHLKKAIDSGGLNVVEIDAARYQSAQLFLQEEKWKEGAAALEEWFKTATSPNSAAYYLLSVAYYQQDDYTRALPPAKKAVELMDAAKPNESWLGMLSALYLQREDYREAIPVLQRLVTIAPDKKTYWMQLSSVYGQMEDYANALGVMQLAYAAGLVTEDSEVRRLSDLLVFNDVPYRGAQVIEAAIEKKIVNIDEKLYEKLANCWIQAGELEKSLQPLQRAAELAASGDLWVRLGEVHVQRDDWTGAIAAVQRGVDKGQLKDPGNAQLMLGIAHYNKKEYGAARPFFERARQSERHRQLADSYLKAIQAQT